MTGVAIDRTNVRISGPVGWIGWVAGRVAPRWSAERLIDAMLRTRRREPSAPDERFRATAEVVEIEVDGHRTRAYAHGRPGAPLVALLHGWDGSASDFKHVVPALVAAGYRTVAIDAPGHGTSDGDQANVVLLARALTEVIDAVGRPVAVVAHSFGAAAAGYAVASGVEVGRLVLIAPVPDPAAYIRALAAVGGERLTTAALAEMGRRIGVPASSVSLASSAARIPVPTTILHDRGDREIPLAAVEALVARWSGVSLLRTDGLGHRRILRDSGVVDLVVRTVGGENERSCAHGGFGPACVQCSFERELFDRRLRWAR